MAMLVMTCRDARRVTPARAGEAGPDAVLAVHDHPRALPHAVCGEQVGDAFGLAEVDEAGVVGHQLGAGPLDQEGVQVIHEYQRVTLRVSV